MMIFLKDCMHQQITFADDATYVDDEEQTFAEKNPITTGLGLTVEKVQ